MKLQGQEIHFWEPSKVDARKRALSAQVFNIPVPRMKEIVHLMEAHQKACTTEKMFNAEAFFRGPADLDLESPNELLFYGFISAKFVDMLMGREKQIRVEVMVMPAPVAE